MTIRIIRRSAVSKRTGKSRSTIYAEMAEGKFPRPVQIGPRAVGWVESEIEEYLAALIAERDAGQSEAGEREAGAPPESDGKGRARAAGDPVGARRAQDQRKGGF
jgi:prophage regulatory protein